MLHNKRGHDSERPAHRDEEWPLLATTRESPRTETKTQHSQKQINKLINFKKNVCWNSPVKQFGPVVFFVGRFLTTNSISLIDMGLFRLSIYPDWSSVVCVFKEFVHFIKVAEF